MRDLHARNVAVLLGADMGQSVDAMVYWTDRGRVTGGTGMAIRLARHYGVPVLNLAETDPREAMRRLGPQSIGWRRGEILEWIESRPRAGAAVDDGGDKTHACG